MDISLRTTTHADADALLDLYVAVDIADTGYPSSDLVDVTWKWREPGFSLALDSLVVERDGSIVAHATVFEGEAEVYIHPEHRGTGIGTWIAGAVERRAADRSDSPDGYVRQNATNRNESAHQLLQARGYERSHDYARMEIELGEQPAVPAAPKGVTVRTFQPGTDERAVYQAEIEAWSQYVRFRDPGYERWSAVFAEDDFDPDLWLVAYEGDRLIAFSQNAGYPDLGWIQNLSTVPGERGRGVGELLVRSSFELYWNRGIKRVGLTVSSERDPSVRRLYERCGMTEVLRITNYAKPLA